MTESKDPAQGVEKLEAERDALAAELKALREQMPVAFMHDQETRRDCVHIEVLDFLQRANSHYGCVNKIQRIPLDTTEHYTIPLYARPVPAEPVNARLLEALKRLSFCAQTTGGVAGRDDELCSAIEASAKAIAEAEAKQAGPARLTDEVIERLWYSSRGISTLFARAIETSILERNGFNPQAKGD